MNLIEQTKSCTVSKQYFGNIKIYDNEKEKAEGNTLRMYKFKVVERKTRIDKPDGYPYPITQTGVDSHNFTIPKEFYNPNKMHFPLSDKGKSPLKSPLGLSIDFTDVKAHLRFQCEFFPPDCKPWETVTDYIWKLIGEGWLVAPINRDDLTTHGGEFYPELKEYGGHKINTAEELLDVILGELKLIQIDWYRDFTELLDEMNAPSTARTYKEKGVIKAYYQKDEDSRVKLYDRRDKKYNLRRFEAIITNGLPITNYREYSLDELKTACKIRCIDMALRKPKIFNNKGELVRYSDQTLWLWFDRFFELESPKRLKVKNERFPKESYRLKRQLWFRTMKKILELHLDGFSTRDVQGLYNRIAKNEKLFKKTDFDEESVLQEKLVGKFKMKHRIWPADVVKALK